jgi:hypothetical protein
MGEVFAEFDYELATCQGSGACPVADSKALSGGRVLRTFIDAQGQRRVVYTETATAVLSGEKLLMATSQLMKQLDALPREEAQLVLLGVQAMMGPAKAVVGLAGNVIVSQLFGDEIEEYKHSAALSIAEQLTRYSKDRLSTSDSNLKGLTADGQINQTGDPYVRGAAGLLDIALGGLGGVAGKAASKTVSIAVKTSSGQTNGGPISDRKGPCCFAAGTMVATPGGDKAIEALKVGDIVWSKPENGGEPFAAAVTATHVRTDQAIYRLKIKSIDGAGVDTLLVTDSHPFYVPARHDFIPLIDLRPGDQLQSLSDGGSNHATIAVESIELVKPQGTTYNLTVDIGHTFYVGGLKTWVHNSGPCEEPACKGGSCAVGSGSEVKDGRKDGGEASSTSPIAKEHLEKELLAAQAKDPRIGTVLPGAKAPITVTAESNIGGVVLVDTNQTARPSVKADSNKPTLIADLIPPGKPNATMANAHAEIGLLQQAYDAGLTQGQSMTMVVRGEEVCSYCRANLSAAAERSGLNNLKVVDTVKGRVYEWVRGEGWVE